MRNHKNSIYLYLLMLFISISSEAAERTPDFVPSYSGGASSQSRLSPEMTHTPGELIVRLHPTATAVQLRALSKKLGAESVSPIFSPSTPGGQHPQLRRIYCIRFPMVWELEPLLQKFAQHTAIESVELNRLNRFCAETVPNDPRYPEQWNLKMLNLPKAWPIEQGSPEVTIAVVDSGIVSGHPEFRNQLWQNRNEIPDNGVDDDANGYIDDINGWDFSDAPTLPGQGDWTERDNTPEDETGHGSHVSGIIAAEANNGIGIAGIASGCRLMPLRAGFVSAAGAFLQNDDVAAAIVYAADNGAQVINMSWGDTVNAFIVQDAVAYAYHRGCVLVAASGNSAEAGSYYPAALKTVMSVASLEADRQLEGGSNFGASIDIAAPGAGILSIDLKEYKSRPGTSMAAAHVSGVAALLISANPTCTNTTVRQALTHTAQPLFLTPLVGAGLLDAYAALTEQIALTARIAAPQIRQDRKIAVFGSAGGNKFVKYWLEFGMSETPALWYPLGIPQTEPKFDAVLYEWDTTALAEGIYTLRLSVAAEDRKTVRDKVVVSIAHTLPRISKHEAGVWFSGNRVESVVIWQTDVLTLGEVEIFPATADYENQEGTSRSSELPSTTPIRVARTESVHRQHIAYLSEIGLPPGEYLYRLTAQNRTGLQQIDDNNGALYPITVVDAYIQPFHLSQVASVEHDLHPIAAEDMNRNGKLELIDMGTDADGSTVLQIFEANDDSTYKLIYKQVFSPSERLALARLWGTADTDGDGLLEILGNSSDGTFLLEQPALGEFPKEQIWKTTEIWGGTIVDGDADGNPEIFSRYRYNGIDAIGVYEADQDNSYRNTTVLENPTHGKNKIEATRFAVGDFDADGQMEILTGDSDAEMFIYENTGDNRYRHTWAGMLPEGIPILLAAGDLTGDGIPEFAVGAKVWTDKVDIPRQHWLFTIFTTDGNNTYRPIWQQRIRDLQDGALTIADANNDGQNELCIAVPPNFYLVQYDGVDFHPIWHHPASNTFNIVVADADNDGANELLFNNENALTVFKDFQQTGPLAPAGISAKPISETSIRLQWQAAQAAITYTIYRRHDSEPPKPIRIGITETYFVDTKLTTGKTYWYVIESRGLNGARVGPKSTAVAVVPTPLPRLTSAVYSAPNQLLLQFDKPMGTSAAHPARYRLHRDASGTMDNTQKNYAPQSAILVHSRQRVVLTFPAGVLRHTDSRYQIETLQLSDIYGADIAADASMLTVEFPAQSLAAVSVYPNPARENQVTFSGLPEGTRIGIYDVGGNLVASLFTAEIDRCRKVWHFTDISSGVYIYVLESATGRHVGKLSIIH